MRYSADVLRDLIVHRVEKAKKVGGIPRLKIVLHCRDLDEEKIS